MFRVWQANIPMSSPSSVKFVKGCPSRTQRAASVTDAWLDLPQVLSLCMDTRDLADGLPSEFGQQIDGLRLVSSFPH